MSSGRRFPVEGEGDGPPVLANDRRQIGAAAADGGSGRFTSFLTWRASLRRELLEGGFMLSGLTDDKKMHAMDHGEWPMEGAPSR